MAKFKNDKGLTLIELLITIAVLAVVSAIALPVINNVVSSSNSNALQQTIKDANDFINKYSKSGVVAYDGLTKTFSGYIDTDGDNTIDADEKIDTLTLDANKFAASTSGTSAALGGSYTNGGVTSVTITATGGAPVAPAVTVSSFVAGEGFMSTGGGSSVSVMIYSGSNFTFAFADGASVGGQLSSALTSVSGPITVTFAGATWQANVSSSNGTTTIAGVPGTWDGAGGQGQMFANKAVFDSVAKTLVMTWE
jgi:prepilin-type N-terminal cleavage/methylation domain-containing protein